MFRRLFLLSLSCAVLFFANGGCYPGGGVGPVSKTATQQRLNLPNWGVVIDASYERKLDGVVPGYRIMTIALTNRSVDMMKLDPVNDQWTVEDAWGRKQRAVVSLRIRDGRTWAQLPPRVQDLVEYPAGVQMGYTQTFDIFFPEHVDLERFRSISFYSAMLKQNFDALSNTSLERAVPAGEEVPTEVPDKFKTPTPSKTSKKTSSPQKYR